MNVCCSCGHDWVNVCCSSGHDWVHVYRSGGREWGKSVSIKMVEVFKQAYWRLAKLMVREGRLPDADLLMFLTHPEIGRLLTTRSGRLVAR